MEYWKVIYFCSCRCVTRFQYAALALIPVTTSETRAAKDVLNFIITVSACITVFFHRLYMSPINVVLPNIYGNKTSNVKPIRNNEILYILKKKTVFFIRKTPRDYTNMKCNKKQCIMRSNVLDKRFYLSSSVFVFLFFPYVFLFTLKKTNSSHTLLNPRIFLRNLF